MREADALHDILPARIGVQAVEDRQRQLDDGAPHPLLVRLFEPVKHAVRVAQASVDHREIEGRHELVIAR